MAKVLGKKIALKQELSLTGRLFRLFFWAAIFWVCFATIKTDAWIHRSICSSYANFSYVKPEAVLRGSVYLTFKGKSAKECETECVNEFFCKSINIENGGDKTCELNNEHVLEKVKNLQLTSKAGWTYRATDYSDPWVGDNCKALKPCPVNHVCVDSCNCPGYRCVRCLGMNIGISCLATIAIEGTPLGMENKEITNYQITASSHFNGNPSDARLNLDGRWCAFQNNTNQFIKVRFHSRKIITDVGIQDGYDHQSWVKTYELMYTEDRTTWKTYEEDGIIKVFRGPEKGDQIIKESLIYYIQAYEVKLIPKAWHSWICMRMELYGIEDPWQPPLPTEIAGDPLGLEDKSVADHQISSSSFTFYRARRARPQDPGWRTDTQNVHQYIRVDFPARMIITAVAVQGSRYNYYWVKSYWFIYSEDSFTWKYYIREGATTTMTFPGSTSNDTPVKTTLPYWIRAFAIKLNPRSWETNICMRLELYGIKDPYQPMIPEGCSNNARPLGMASKAIPDSNITASAYSFGKEPRKGRINENDHWCEKNGAYGIHSFLQVDLGKSMIVVAVATQGKDNGGSWVKSYRVGYSDINGNFKWVTNGSTNVTFLGNVNNHEIVKNKLRPPIRARYVRVAPATYNNNMCMRMELYGCDPL